MAPPEDAPPGLARMIGLEKHEHCRCPYPWRGVRPQEALGGHKRSHIIADTAFSSDGELYGSASVSVNEEQEQGYPVAAAGSLDLNFPPAPSEEA